MAKKKHQGKKHKFKYASESSQAQVATTHHEPSALVSGPGSGMGATAARPSGRPGGTAAVADRDFSYVTTDLKRIVVLMAALVLLEFGLWALMIWTGLGSIVQSLIRL